MIASINAFLTVSVLLVLIAFQGTTARDEDGTGVPPPPDAPASDDDGTGDSNPERRHDASNSQPLLYDALLRSEMLGEKFDPATHSMQATSTSSSKATTPLRERDNNLRFVSQRQMHMNGLYRYGARDNHAASVINSYNISPVSSVSNRRFTLGTYAEQRKRKISKVPFKVLDAPALQDDYYLNLGMLAKCVPDRVSTWIRFIFVSLLFPPIVPCTVDWSCQNVLAVALHNCVYLWSATTNNVTKLVDISNTEDLITSVAWSETGKHLAVGEFTSQLFLSTVLIILPFTHDVLLFKLGTTQGDVQLWDAAAESLVRVMSGHSARVGAIAWNGASSGLGSSLLVSGSRDRLIHLRDPRSDRSYEARLVGHKQEVCGLKVSDCIQPMSYGLTL